VSSFNACQVGQHHITLISSDATENQTSKLNIGIAPAEQPADDFRMAVQISIGVAVDQADAICDIGAAITALLPTSGVAVVVELQHIPDGLLNVTYGVRDITTLDWMVPVIVDGAAVSQQLGYTTNADQDSTTTDRSLRLAVLVLGMLALVALVVLLSVWVYKKRNGAGRHNRRRALTVLSSNGRLD
jgi:hypothetical protein